MTVNGVTSAYNSFYNTQQTSVGKTQDLSELIAQRVAEKDTDGDQALSLEESGMEEELFSSLDSDADGLVTSAEILAFIESMKTEMAGAPPPPPTAEDLIAALDSDGDGGLSLAESGASQEQFDAADTNEDGIVSQAELEAAFLNGQASMPAGDMMAAAAVSSLHNLSNYQKQQDDALLDWLKGEDDESSSTSFLYGQPGTKSIDLLA